MSTAKEFYFPSCDGVHSCFAKEWRPDEGTPVKGVVQLVHGVSEYVERYDRFARFLADRGFLVTGNDHLGHGKTVDDGMYGYFGFENGWSLVEGDIRELRVMQGDKYSDLPYFMLGHSMGSFLARTYLIDYPGTLTGALLSGTGQESGFAVSFAKWLANLICNLRGPEYHSKLITNLSLGSYNRQFRPNRTSADWISRDNAVVDAYLKDKFCSFSPTAGMFRDMMGGLQYIADKENLAKMDKKTPVYLYSGAKDPVGACGKGVKKVYGYFLDAGCTDVTMKLWPDGRHEMHNETNYQEVYADVVAWLESRLDGRKPG